MAVDESQYWATIVQVSLVLGAAMGIEARWSAVSLTFEQKAARRLVGAIVVIGAFGLLLIFSLALSQLAFDPKVHHTLSTLVNYFLLACASALVFNPIIVVASGRNADLGIAIGRVLPWSNFWRSRRALSRALRRGSKSDARAERAIAQSMPLLQGACEVIKRTEQYMVDGQPFMPERERKQLFRSLNRDAPQMAKELDEALESNSKARVLETLHKQRNVILRGAATLRALTKKSAKLRAEIGAERSKLRLLHISDAELKDARATAERVAEEAKARLALSSTSIRPD